MTINRQEKQEVQVLLSDRLQKFAALSGARFKPVAPIKEENAISLPQYIEDEPQVDRPQTDEKSFIQTKFETNKVPWKNGKYTLGAALVAGTCVIAGITALSGFSLKLPKGDTSTATKPVDNSDDLTDHPTGKYGVASQTGGLGEGFDNEGKTKNPFLTTNPPNTKPNGKTKAPPHVKVGALPTSSVPRTSPVVRSAPATDYDSPRVMPRRYTPSYSSPVRTSAFRSNGSASSPAKSAEPERTPEERRAQAIAATTFSGGSSNVSAQNVSTNPQDVSANPQGGVQEGLQGASQGIPQGRSSKDEQYLAAENAVIDGTPQQLINRAKKAEGVLLQGLAFTPGNLKYLEDQEITAEISNPLDSGLPVGTQIFAAIKFPQIQAQAKNAVVRLVPTAIVLNGNEYEVPTGSAVLTGKNGKPFIAKRGGSEFLRFLGSATKTVIGAGTGVLTSLSGLGGGNLLSSLTGLGGARGANTQSNPTEVLILKDNIPIQFSIIRPFSIPMATSLESESVPVASVSETQTSPTQGDVAVAQPRPEEAPMMFTQDLTDAELMAIVDQSRTPGGETGVR
jgi:hypothetical protein